MPGAICPSRGRVVVAAATTAAAAVVVVAVVVDIAADDENREGTGPVATPGAEATICAGNVVLTEADVVDGPEEKREIGDEKAAVLPVRSLSAFPGEGWVTAKRAGDEPILETCDEVADTGTGPVADTIRGEGEVTAEDPADIGY